MALNLRTLGIALAVIGVGFGVAFGAGVAYGRGDPKTVQGGLTPQQIQSLLGISGAQGGGAGGTTDPTGAGRPGQAQGGAAAQATARNATGRVVSVAGNTITIETAQGQTKVNVTPATTYSRITPSTLAELKAGTNIVAGGTRNADGSFNATSISEVPAELSTTPGGGFGGGQGAPGGPATTATPVR
jgi:hypothetical protein